MPSIILEPPAFVRAAGPARFVFPELRDVLERPEELPSPVGDTPPPSELAFDEADLARVAAAVGTDAGRRERARAEASLDEALRLATLAMGECIGSLVAARRHDVATFRLAVQRVFGLFATSCLDIVAGTRLCAAMTGAVERVLADLPDKTDLLIEVAPELAERVRLLVAGACAELPTLRPTVLGRNGVAPGDVLMSWQDGWAEWSFGRLRQSLADQLAADLADQEAVSLSPVPAPIPAIAE